MIKTQEQANQAYIDMLNECYSIKQFKKDNPHWSYRGEPAEMMEFNDPIMYRCSFNDWIDGMVTDRQAIPEAIDFCVE